MGECLGKWWIPALAGMTAFLPGISATAAGRAPDPGNLALTAGIASGHIQLHAPAPLPVPTAQIAIIIDDLGQQHGAGLRAIDLPGAVAVSFLPSTDYAASQAQLAYAHGKEVLMHLPLEPGGNARAYPTAITTNTGKIELSAYFEAALASVPHARGVNNHQGSRLTELAEPMNWL